MSYTINVKPVWEPARLFEEPPALPTLEAFQLDRGLTTATQLWEFCGTGNIIAMIRNDDERDIPILAVLDGGTWQDVADGDWIVKQPDGSLSLLYPHDFARHYRPATEEDARSRNAMDPTLPGADTIRKIGRSFAAFVREQKTG